MYKFPDYKSNKVKLYFTPHSLERLKETRMSINEAYFKLRTGEIDKTVKQKAKFQKYGKKQETIFYVRNGDYLFTINYDKGRLWVITVTDMRINYKFF